VRDQLVSSATTTPASGGSRREAVGVNEAELASSLAVAAVMTGESPCWNGPRPRRMDGWHEPMPRFPNNGSAERFRGARHASDRTGGAESDLLTLDAGLAFGTGEHGPQGAVWSRWRRWRGGGRGGSWIMGTGSGILGDGAHAC